MAVVLNTLLVLAALWALGWAHVGLRKLGKYVSDNSDWRDKYYPNKDET